MGEQLEEELPLVGDLGEEAPALLAGEGVSALLLDVAVRAPTAHAHAPRRVTGDCTVLDRCGEHRPEWREALADARRRHALGF